MTQPSFVPILETDQVRPAYTLRTPADWRADRVGDLRTAGQPRGRDLGVPGPDQGYVLLLADRLFAERIELADGEHADDVLQGAAAVAGARAALFGRAPVGKDLELVLTLFGYLGGAPPELVRWRTPLFRGASHHYHERRQLVNLVPDATLRLTPDQLRARLADWRTLVADPA